MESPEQAPSTPPPKKRRRWLIVSVVLVLVSMTSWWYWPRGDGRFVGKWQYKSTVVELGPGGWGQITDRKGTTGQIRWWVVDGDTLRFDMMPSASGLADQLRAIQRQIAFQLWGTPLAKNQMAARSGQLTRIPE